jgi:hypothetical protein
MDPIEALQKRWPDWSIGGLTWSSARPKAQTAQNGTRTDSADLPSSVFSFTAVPMKYGRSG